MLLVYHCYHYHCCLNPEIFFPFYACSGDSFFSLQDKLRIFLPSFLNPFHKNSRFIHVLLLIPLYFLRFYTLWSGFCSIHMFEMVTSSYYVSFLNICMGLVCNKYQTVYIQSLSVALRNNFLAIRGHCDCLQGHHGHRILYRLRYLLHILCILLHILCRDLQLFLSFLQGIGSDILIYRMSKILH